MGNVKVEDAISFVENVDVQNLRDMAIKTLILSILDMVKNGGWILCSERLPSIEECQRNDTRFIVTDGNRTYQGYYDYEINCFVKMAKEDAFINCEDKRVIAWQPLPHAYKAE